MKKLCSLLLVLACLTCQAQIKISQLPDFPYSFPVYGSYVPIVKWGHL